MTKLNHDWITEGLIDFEYKKYVLLAYLKDVRGRFNESELYPFLSDLVFHYSNLKKIKDQKQLLYSQFPESLSKADFEKLKISYKKIVEDDAVMAQLQEIISYAIPRIDSAIKEGKEIYDFVEENMEFSPVGLTPIYDQEGYLFLNRDAERQVSIYRYAVSVFESSNEKYRGISTTYVGDEFQDFSRTYEKIKLDLAKRFSDLPNPASFLAVSKLSFPKSQTLLPIAKRLLIRYVST